MTVASLEETSISVQSRHRTNMRTRQWIKGYGWLFPELECLQKTLSRELTESQGSSKQVAAFGRLLY